jgi:hypothetical protein
MIKISGNVTSTEMNVPLFGLLMRERHLSFRKGERAISDFVYGKNQPTNTYARERSSVLLALSLTGYTGRYRWRNGKTNSEVLFKGCRYAARLRSAYNFVGPTIAIA